MSKDIAIETAENQLGNAGSPCHLVNTPVLMTLCGILGVRCWKIPPHRIAD